MSKMGALCGSEQFESRFQRDLLSTRWIRSPDLRRWPLPRENARRPPNPQSHKFAARPALALLLADRRFDTELDRLADCHSSGYQVHFQFGQTGPPPTGADGGLSSAELEVDLTSRSLTPTPLPSPPRPSTTKLDSSVTPFSNEGL